MTTGSEIKDYTSATPLYKRDGSGTSLRGNTYTGHYSARVWSVGDSPKKPRKKEFLHYFLEVPYWQPPRTVIRHRREKRYRQELVLVHDKWLVTSRTSDGRIVKTYRSQPRWKLKWVVRRVRVEYSVVLPGRWRIKRVLRKRLRQPDAIETPVVNENPYDCTYTRYYTAVGERSQRVYAAPDINRTRYYYDYEQGWDHGLPLPIIDPWTSNDTIRTSSKLREALQGSDFHLGIFIAEGKEAAHLIGNSARSIHAAITAVRQKRYDVAWRHLWQQKPEIGRKPPVPYSDAAAMTLTIQYGIRPLLNDVQSAAEYLAERTLARPKHVVRTSKKKKHHSQRNENRSGAYYDKGVDSFTSYRLKAILENVDGPRLLGANDVASIVWEKVPYSFVADWFVPIGEWLQALNTKSALTGKFVYSTMSKHRFGGTSLRPGYNDQNEPAEDNPADYHWESIQVKREITAYLNVPDPSVKSLRQVASWQHAVNSIALLVNAYASSKVGKRWWLSAPTD